jgi:hypothetical protein
MPANRFRKASRRTAWFQAPCQNEETGWPPVSKCLNDLASPRDVKSKDWRGFSSGLPVDPRLIHQPFPGISPPRAEPSSTTLGTTSPLLHWLAVLEATSAERLNPLPRLGADGPVDRHDFDLEVVMARATRPTVYATETSVAKQVPALAPDSMRPLEMVRRSIFLSHTLRALLLSI